MCDPHWQLWLSESKKSKDKKCFECKKVLKESDNDWGDYTIKIDQKEYDLCDPCGKINWE